MRDRRDRAHQPLLRDRLVQDFGDGASLLDRNVASNGVELMCDGGSGTLGRTRGAHGQNRATNVAQRKVDDAGVVTARRYVPEVRVHRIDNKTGVPMPKLAAKLLPALVFMCLCQRSPMVRVVPRR